MSEERLSDKLYNMGLNGKMNVDDYTMVRRVPGGWIYTEYQPFEGSAHSDDTYTISSVFVPYNNEFDFRDMRLGEK